MTINVKNPTQIPKEVHIQLADGTKTSIFIQPNSKANLPPGANVLPESRERDPSIRVVTE